MDFASTVFKIDDRKDYGENRIVGFGPILGRLHVVVFVLTRDGIRVISFRKANAKEIHKYEKEITNLDR